MPHRGETVEGLPADALRRAVGGDELWVARLENAELVQEPVVVEIADLGCRLEVVAPVGGDVPEEPFEVSRLVLDGVPLGGPPVLLLENNAGEVRVEQLDGCEVA